MIEQEYQKLKQELSIDCYESVGKLSFHGLLDGYALLENSMPLKILDTINRYLTIMNIVCENDTVLYKNEIYSIIIEVVKSKRVLYVMIADTNPLTNLEQSSYTSECEDSVGVIKYVELLIPNNINIDAKQLLELILYHIRLFYRVIEQSYLENSDLMHKKVFASLYSYFDFYVKSKNRNDLIGKYWFAIGYKNAFHYFHDYDKSRALLEKLKTTKTVEYSPFELLISIIKTPLNFYESLGAQSWRDKKPVTKKWSELDYKSNKKIYYIAERTLYPSDGHTAFSISEHREYILSMGIDNRAKEDVVKLMEEVLTVLDNLFREGVRDYSIFFKTIAKIQQMKLDEKEMILLSRMIGAGTAEFIKTVS